ncbi:hypothetical protein GDO78_017308, partial [Eleutherodactylus coqui]
QDIYEFPKHGNLCWIMSLKERGWTIFVEVLSMVAFGNKSAGTSRHTFHSVSLGRNDLPFLMQGCEKRLL